MDAWLLLIVSLPPHPSSLRVKTWRKLRTLGAVPLKNSVYLLPSTPESYEHFQWLTQAIQKDRGEATLVKVDRIENLKPSEVISLFQHARNRDYGELARRYRKLLGSLDRRRPRRTAARLAEELARLGRELARIKEIDFFEAPGFQEVQRLKETVAMRLPPPTAVAEGPAEIPPDSLRARRWVTRPRPHIDRIASAWLIRRFIDPEAQFLFAPPEEFPADAIPFDALGAQFGHQGEDCTFETLLRRCGLSDRCLTQLAEIVHEVDLRDDKYHRDEARGVDLAVRGLLAALKDDYEVLAHGMTLFDGLYAALSELR